MSKPSTIKIDNVEYVRKDSVYQKPKGNRAVVVVDRGWIFAGDVTEKDGRIYLSRAVWLFRWQSVGFAKVVEDPESTNADIRKIDDVDIPSGAEVFRIPVDSEWGL